MSAQAAARKLEQNLAAYARMLEAAWGSADEEILAQAYQLGRELLQAGVSLLELSEFHHRVLASLAEEHGLDAERLRSAGRLLNEVEAGYEMLLRGYHDANSALRRANERLEEQIEQIARALHDESGQLLAAAMIQFDQVARSLPDLQRASLAPVRQLLDEIEFGIRRLAHELHPALLSDLGLRPALEFLADGVAGRSGLHVTVEGDLPQRLPHAVELCLYRCAQECLNNVVRHAHASHASLHLQQQGKSVELGIHDDGQGFAIPAPPSGTETRGMGLTGLRERLRGVDGELTIHTHPGAGVTIQLRVPIPFAGGLGGNSPVTG